MITFSWFIFLSLLSMALADGQISPVDGIIGGVSQQPNETGVSALKLAFVESVSETASNISTTITPGKLRYVENSGICETTPGVYQASGYADIALNQSMWFWFFAARENSDMAPLAVWLNGGPGSSSMLGLFQENGPCRMNSDEETVSRNPYSWNEYANMLYIDQPIGAGYSYGDIVVESSKDAAVDMWKMLQIFFSDPKFKQYASRDFAIWTESYGGHYGPAFAEYFLKQNAEIAAGRIPGVTINLKVLSIGNGITDPYSQYPGYVNYALSNPYHQLVTNEIIENGNETVFMTGGCLSKIANCTETGTNAACRSAQGYCNSYVLNRLHGRYNVYDVRVKDSKYPYDLSKLLSNSSFMASIGARSAWNARNFDVYNNFGTTGDWMRNSRPILEKVIDAGVRTLLVNGDADYMCNYMGLELMIDALQTKFSEEYKQQTWTNWTVAGNPAGLYKNAGMLSYIRVHGAGHKIPAYGNGNLEVGQAALSYFVQAMQGKFISST
ncbi:unnamed protein product [Rhizoctonia solani]|uniref:Carboxypeptidase n=1 Tax=Rhizoctonia solani TaxID=456999 RepID=A0A8H2Y1G6_9AGAM|nr:unnamed protein product [Rhizoctonia solani]